MSDAELMRLVEQARADMEPAARVEISILNGIPRNITTLFDLTRRYPEIDWSAGRMITSADVILVSGNEIGFRRQSDSGDIHIWSDTPAGLPQKLVKALKKQTLVPAKPLSVPAPRADVDIRKERLRTLNINILEVGEVSRDVSRLEMPVAVRTPVSVAARKVQTNWKSQENIAFALTTGHARPGNELSAQNIGAAALIVGIFIAGVLLSVLTG